MGTIEKREKCGYRKGVECYRTPELTWGMSAEKTDEDIVSSMGREHWGGSAVCHRVTSRPLGQVAQPQCQVPRHLRPFTWSQGLK